MTNKPLNAQLTHPDLPSNHEELSALAHALHHIFKEEYAIDLKAPKILHALGKGLGFENAHHMKKVLDAHGVEMTAALSEAQKRNEEQAATYRQIFAEHEKQSEESAKRYENHQEMMAFMEIGSELLKDTKFFYDYLLAAIGSPMYLKNRDAQIIIRKLTGAYEFSLSDVFDSKDSEQIARVQNFLNSTKYKNFVEIIERTKPSYFTADESQPDIGLAKAIFDILRVEHKRFFDSLSMDQQSVAHNSGAAQNLNAVIQNAVVIFLSRISNGMTDYIQALYK